MVESLGMSDKFGLRVKIKQDDDLGNNTNEVRDNEINKILNDSYKRAMDILSSRRKEMDELAQALLKYETLDAKDVESILGPGANKS